jgi:hypothetical protein
MDDLIEDLSQALDASTATHARPRVVALRG